MALQEETSASTQPATDHKASLELPTSVLKRLRGRLRRAIKGRDEVIDLVLVALMADGHVLLEDYPGSGKTVLAKALGDSIQEAEKNEDKGPCLASFRRIQFTPDLLPSDITGTSIFDAQTATFQFREGPLFAYIVLGDEINRTSPKVQAAMLEAMAEKQVTVDNVSYKLDDLFFVIATQNPRDQAGTYPLPVAQLDRFLFKIRMEFIDREAELEVLHTLRERRAEPGEEFPRVSRADIVVARKATDDAVFVSPLIHTCLVDTARAIRANPKVVQGVSTRSLVLLLPALQASAVLRGREYVIGDDVQWLAPYVFAHRMELAAGVESAHDVVRECLKEPLEKLARTTLKG